MLPSTIHTDVRPYDDHQRELLSRLAAWPEIERLVANGLMVPKEQFLVYSVFRWRDTRDLPELRDLARAEEHLLDATLQCTSESFSAHPRLDAKEHRPEAQAIGEALGLCFMDAVFKTNEADWRRIPEGAGKTLDFVGSDGKLRLEIESKGSFVPDRLRKDAISHHKGDIGHKKSGSPAPRNGVRIGTIASLDRQPSGRPLLWLTDPPVDAGDRTPEDLRLLNRMEFLSRAVAMISPRSPLAAALATRVLDLQSIRDISQLDGVPLMAGPDSPLHFETDFGKIHNRFFGTRSVVDDGPAGGVAVRASADRMFFAGVRQDWIEMAVEQHFSAVRRYGGVPATVAKVVRIALPRGAFQRFGLNEAWRFVRQTGGYYRFPLEGDLHYSAGGLVFGWLSIPEGLR